SIFSITKPKLWVQALSRYHVGLIVTFNLLHNYYIYAAIDMYANFYLNYAKDLFIIIILTYTSTL
ncbi:MAG: hypothetical protein ACK4M7_11080, partial [Burkholderiales bacterium]